MHRLCTPSGYCYLKVHRDRPHWEREVHAYERWVTAFGCLVPRLLVVRDEVPLALVVSELPGVVLEQSRLSLSQERQTWRAAGRALAALHDLAVGTYFGPCRRDGSPAGTPFADARAYIAANLEGWVERGMRLGCLADDELAIVRAARHLIPAFEGERPIPCHRDYSPANWLVGADGALAGVIDFEFAHWDARAADFARYPSWEWMHRPDLLAAFCEGYGRPFTPREEQQCLVARVQYALSAIVWGTENAYLGFAAEGRAALRRLGALLG